MKTTQPTQQIAILVKFHPATNSKGSRFSLSLPRWNGRKRFFSYNHAFNDTLDNALHVLGQNAVPVAAVLDLGDHYGFAVEWANRPQVFKLMGLKES